MKCSNSCGQKVKFENRISSPVYLPAYIFVVLCPLRWAAMGWWKEKLFLSSGRCCGLFFSRRERKGPANWLRSFAAPEAEELGSFSRVKVFWMCRKQDPCKAVPAERPVRAGERRPDASWSQICRFPGLSLYFMERSSHFYINIFKHT